MSGSAAKTKRGGGAASSTKRKKAHESRERPVAKRKKAAKDDDEASFEASGDEAEEGVSEQTSEDADSEEVIEQPPRRKGKGKQAAKGPAKRGRGRGQEEDVEEDVSEHTSEDDFDSEEDVVEQLPRQKGKGKQAAKGPAKRGRGREQDEDDDGDSGPSGKAKDLKVERHATVVARAKKELKIEKKKLGAKGEKVTMTLGVSDSSTEDGGGPHHTYVAGKKGQTFKEGRNRAGRRVARAMNKSVLDLEDSYPPRTADEFKSLIPTPQYDEYWSKEQQSELFPRLSADEHFKKRTEVTPFVVNVWKTAFRFTGRLATDIIGPKTGLEFKSDSPNAFSPVWTQRFCEALTAIILHPLFKLRTQKMALAMQWAVICRTGYKSKYKLNRCRDDHSLEALASVVDGHQEGSMTPSELLEAAAVEYERLCGPDADPSTWLQFLGHIEKKIVRGSDDATDDADDVDGGPYFVNTTDLYAVKSALDRIKHLGLRMFADSRQVVDAVMPTRTKYDVPTVEQTQQAIKAVLFQKERNKERVRRGGRPEPSSTPSWDLPEDHAAGSGGREEATDDENPFATPVAVKARKVIPHLNRPKDGDPGGAEGDTISRRDSHSLGDMSSGSQHQDDDLGMYDFGSGADGIGYLGMDPPSSPDEAPPAGAGAGEPVGAEASGSHDPVVLDKTAQAEPGSEEDGGGAAVPSRPQPAASKPTCIRRSEVLAKFRAKSLAITRPAEGPIHAMSAKGFEGHRISRFDDF